MLNQLSPKERLGYFAIAVLLLFGFGYVGAQHLRRTPDIVFQPLQDQTASATTPAPVKEVVVHVVGRVHKPGMIRLAPEARVADAIAECGGAAPDADLEALNLAAPLVDGSQLQVPEKGKAAPEQHVESYEPVSHASYTSRSSGRSGSGSGTKNPSPESVSLNSATQAQLETLPGIGPVTAKKILEYRQAHGGFSSVEELLAVKGIGPKKLESMRKFVRL